jgi:hypothetical protein
MLLENSQPCFEDYMQPLQNSYLHTPYPINKSIQAQVHLPKFIFLAWQTSQYLQKSRLLPLHLHKTPMIKQYKTCSWNWTCQFFSSMFPNTLEVQSSYLGDENSSIEWSQQDFTKPYPLSLTVMICEFNLHNSWTNDCATILIKINITLFIQLFHFHLKKNKINIENIGYNA